ncbi:MAG: SPOR domain-containing protein [Pseudomonadota bacterium]|nr:SPOR domain-containing protein [Pseudomonadota bacterium]
MSDARAEDIDDGDRLPWLEAVDEDEAEDGPSALKLIAAVVIGLVAIGLVVGGLFWLGNRGGGEGDAELIEAPEGAYKVAPEDPGGMQVDGQGDTAHAASAGDEPRGNLSMNVPEAPVTPGQQQQAQPQQQAQQQPARPQQQAQQPPQPSPAAGATIQLGAFGSQAAANNAWRALSGRFTYLAPLSHSVTPVQSGGRTLYRLRASGPNAEDVCRRLRVAGETCTPVR